VVPKRVADRFVRTIGKFKQILAVAKDRDVNESDTVAIIKDILSEVFGYDKYLEITSEFAVRGTYCDIAIKQNNKVEYLIEAKAIGLDLKENHLRQAIEYGANNGVQWVILTNGLIWQIHRIRFEKPIDHELLCSIDFANLDPKNEEHQERLYVVCKEGLVKDAREDFHERIQIVNRFTLGAFILSEEFINILRRELRKFSEGVSVSIEDISKVLVNEVLKRDVVEGEEAIKAQKRIGRFYGKSAKRAKEPEEKKPDAKEHVESETKSPSTPDLPKDSE
jgi:predicted type IV restriction endonuclease